MPLPYPQCPHITRKRGIYHYRRRLPGHARGEVLLSLRTRKFPAAEYLAFLLDRQFDATWSRVVSEVDNTSSLGPILRKALRERLDEDVERRVERSPGTAVYAYWWDPEDRRTAMEADLEEIRERKHQAEHELAENCPHDPDGWREEHVMELLEKNGLPAALKNALMHGMMEVSRRFWEIAEQRTLGNAPVIMQSELPEAWVEPDPLPLADVGIAAPKSEQRNRVPASALVDPFFERRERTDRATHQVMGQERGTLRRFLEAAGDRPPTDYRRADVFTFLDTLRRLPKTYGKSTKDKDRSLDELIAEADARDAERLTDKTVKRHLSALSQFFQFAVDRGHLTVAERVELVEGHRFREGRAARDQRDAWTPEEIVKLFTSPVWSGCRAASRRSEAGNLIIRDARFWLPLLALFHGARLEEFADLYRRDIECDEGTWCVRLVETEPNEDDPSTKRRRLKTSNAARMVPLHPEIIRLGFLDYVFGTAPKPDDPLFPELPPQGKDGKRGPRITRWFVEYRRAIGVYRHGVAMHAFRHIANTRLRDVITDYGRERHVNYLLGHSQGGGQGRERYDKGPGLKAVADTLALLSYPELDLRHLYSAGGESYTVPHRVAAE